MTTSYSEHMKGITKERLLEGLVGYGLFSEKLPPFLTSEDFYDFCMDEDNHPKSSNSNSGLFKNKHVSEYIQYANMRNINVPRLLAVPEPIAYFNLCHCLSQYWPELTDYFESKTKNDDFKISRIHIRRIKESKIIFSLGSSYDSSGVTWSWVKKVVNRPVSKVFSMNYKNLSEDDNSIPKIKIKSRFVVHADVSNCFGSIYTHALSWALIGKNQGKIQRNGYWHNEIDTYTMNVNKGETHGILIGGHAFNIISEIILVAVDEKLKDRYKYIRNIDDYECFVEDYQNAESFLIDLEAELRVYGLTLNHKKTEISELPMTYESDWIRELRYFEEGDYFDYKETVHFLDFAIALMKKNDGNSAVLNYAIQVLSDKKKSISATEYFLDTVHHLALIYPYLISLMDENVFSSITDENLKLEYIKSFSNDIYEVGLKKNYYEALSYALLFSIKYNFRVSGKVFENIENSRDAILYLLGYIHDKKFNNHSKVIKNYKKLAEDLNQNNFDEYWLFIYEVFTKGKFNNGDWKKMKEKNVSFIKDAFKLA